MKNGFKLARFLWIMRGSNDLQALSYYDKEVEKKTDNNKTLRGAYGPRLRNWVGPDQYQEMININQDIDNEEELKKPKGVDQLEKVYIDLKNGLKTCCQIFDPSIDFEDSNDIPNLASIGFEIDKSVLHVRPFYIDNIETDGDILFLSLLSACYASILNVESINMYYLYNDVTVSAGTTFKLTNKTPESLWHDIHLLCDFEQHLRNCITSESVALKTVDILTIIDELIKKFIEPIECVFWKDFGLTLITHILSDYDKEEFKEYVRVSINVKITKVMENR